MRVLATLALCLTLLGCARPELNAGSECALNSDCSAPLICGLERCRRQCVDSRDCGAGLLCLAIGDQGGACQPPDAGLLCRAIGDQGGACQLPEEAVCTLTSRCTSGLECRFGTCTTACAEDRDCPVGAMCQSDPEGSACIEPVTELCIYNSDCPAPLVCGRDQICHLECAEDRDCTRDRFCDPTTNLCEVGEPLDGG